MELAARLIRNPELPPAKPQQQQGQPPALATLDPPLPPLTLPGPNWALPVNVVLIACQPAGAAVASSRDADRSDTGPMASPSSVTICVQAPPVAAVMTAAPESPSASSDHWLPPPPAGLPAAAGSETTDGGTATGARRPSGAPELVLELPGIQAWHQADISLGLPKVKGCAGASRVTLVWGKCDYAGIQKKSALWSTQLWTLRQQDPTLLTALILSAMYPSSNNPHTFIHTYTVAGPRVPAPRDAGGVPHPAPLGVRPPVLPPPRRPARARGVLCAPGVDLVQPVMLRDRPGPPLPGGQAVH